MVKIEYEEFFPKEGDKDFKVKLKTPSYSEYKDVEIEADKATPSGGPEAKVSPARMKAYVQKLLSTCIVEVKGLEIHGKTITTGLEFADHAPEKIIWAVVNKILLMAKAGDDEIKN